MRTIYRDAGTGKIVTSEYAENNPLTTVSETIKDKEYPLETVLDFARHYHKLLPGEKINSDIEVLFHDFLDNK